MIEALETVWRWLQPLLQAIAVWFSGASLIFELVFLGYFAFINIFYALVLFAGSQRLRRALGRGEVLRINDILETQVYRPISILAPAYNEQETIEASVKSFLNLHYPEFEVVVINDGSKDQTIEVLKSVYQLYPVPQIKRVGIQTKAVRGVYRSLLYPNLVVVDKENGGKADALNVGLLHSRYPIFCAVDADSLLEPRALLRAVSHFLEDDSVVAVGCNVRVLNGAVFLNEQISELHTPMPWLERFQVLEYLRVFYSTRVVWDWLNMVLIISGAFGLFLREPVLRLGGYRTDTVGEDMELTVRMHRDYLEGQKPYKVAYAPEPVCWTQVPSDWNVLRRQRNRWHRGLWETLWNHKDMLLRPKYKHVGMVALPFFWLLEGISPLVEMLGYAYVLFSVVTGRISVSFASAFLALAVIYGMVISLAALWAETFTSTRYERTVDRFRLLLASILESLGYRQLLSYERAKATFEVLRKRGQWGEMVRKRIKT